MKTLYHGSLEIIEAPEIRTPNRTLDFGAGFYLTSSEKQAGDWVIRRLKEQGLRQGYVNLYDFDEEALTSLHVKVFTTPDEEWLDFVMSNRRTPGFSHGYDLMIGPVANDRVYTAFSLYEGGIISKTTLIAELKTYRLVDQYLVHTPRALSFLKFTTAHPIQL